MYMFLRNLLISLFIIFNVGVNAIGVMPTYVNLSSSEPISNLTFRNDKDVPLTLQIKMVQWLQKEEQEIYKPTENLIATPQIFTIPPHGSQLVRVGLEEPLFSNREQTYRLFAQEVITHRPAANNNTLQIVFKLSIPVFIKPEGVIHQAIRWTSSKMGVDTLDLKATNLGNNVLFINELQAFNSSKQPIHKKLSTFSYLLPGSVKIWKIKNTNLSNPSSIKAKINNEYVITNVG